MMRAFQPKYPNHWRERQETKASSSWLLMEVFCGDSGLRFSGLRFYEIATISLPSRLGLPKLLALRFPENSSRVSRGRDTSTPWHHCRGCTFFFISHHRWCCVRNIRKMSISLHHQNYSLYCTPETPDVYFRQPFNIHKTTFSKDRCDDVWRIWTFGGDAVLWLAHPGMVSPIPFQGRPTHVNRCHSERYVLEDRIRQ